MHWTVFGGEGFIGKRLVDVLREQGRDVFVPGRYDTSKHAPARGYGHAIWAIGLTADFRTRPFDTVDAHVGALTPILRENAFESLLYLSSTRIYQHAITACENAAISVNPNDPSDLYNLSKLAGESVCLAAPESVRVARLSNIVGAREAQRDTFIGALCREAHNGHILLQSASSSAKDYLWIDDAADLLVKIAERGTQRVYNVGSGRRLSHADWLGAITEATGATARVLDGAPETTFPSIDVTRVQSEFAFRASDPLARTNEIVMY